MVKKSNLISASDDPLCDPKNIKITDLFQQDHIMAAVNALRMSGMAEAGVFVYYESNVHILDDLYGLEHVECSSRILSLAKKTLDTGQSQQEIEPDGKLVLTHPVWLHYHGQSYLKGCLAGSPPRDVPHTEIESASLILRVVADALSDKISTVYTTEVANRDRHLLEEKLRLVDNSIVNVIDKVSAAFALIDRDMIVQWHNPMLSQMFSGAEMIGQVCYKAIRGGDSECSNCLVRTTFNTGQPLSGNLCLDTVNGTKYYKATTAPVCDEQGEVRYVLELVQDVTSVRETESELARYKRLVNYSDDLMLVCNGKFDILAANHKFLEATGYTEQEIIGMNALCVVPPDEFDRAFGADMLRTTGIAMENAWVLRKDKSVLPAQMFATYDAETDIYEAVFRDMSERLRLEEEINIRSRELQEQNTKVLAAIEEKNRFFRSVSHELRTPLTSIIGFAELLLEDTDEPLSERQKAQLGRVVGNSHKLLAMVNDLLDLSRLDAGRMRLECASTNLEELLGQIVSNMMPLAQNKKLRVTISIPDKLPSVMTDEQKLGQIIVNLLSNAIKFTENGSVKISAVRDDKWVLISVTDTGVGIPESELEEIFKEFSRGSNSEPKNVGTGLGLAIAKRLAGLLSGEISVTSKAGLGSTFTIKLPITPHKVVECAV